MSARRPTWFQRLLRSEQQGGDGDGGEDSGSSKSGTGSGWQRFRRAMSRSTDPRGGDDASSQHGPVEEEDAERNVGDNAWLFAAEKEAPCCLSCGKRFSVMVTRYNCRACSMAVCTDCSVKRLKLFPNVRVCDRCYQVNSNRTKFEMVPRPAPFVLKKGRLTKMGQVVHTWRARTWILDSNGLLSYFGSDLKRPKGTVNTCRLKRWVDGTSPEFDSVSWPQNTDRERAFVLEFERKTLHIIADSVQDAGAWRVLISMFARQCLHCGESLFSSPTRGGGGDDDDDVVVGFDDNDDDEADVAPVHDDGDDEDDDDDDVVVVDDVDDDDDEDDGGGVEGGDVGDVAALSLCQQQGDGGEEGTTGGTQEGANDNSNNNDNDNSNNNDNDNSNNSRSGSSSSTTGGEAATKTDDRSSGADDSKDALSACEREGSATPTAETVASRPDAGAANTQGSSDNSTVREGEGEIEGGDEGEGEGEGNGSSADLSASRTSFGSASSTSASSRDRCNTVALAHSVNAGDIAFLPGTGTAFHVKCFRCCVCRQRLDPTLDPDTAFDEGARAAFNAEGYIHCRPHAEVQARVESAQENPGATLKGLKLDVTILPAAVLVCDESAYEEQRDVEIRHQAALAAERKLAQQEKRETRQAARAAKQGQQPEPHPHAPVTPQIVMCTLLGIMESLTAVQDMVATDTFEHAGEKFRRKTTLPNGAAYEMIDHSPRQFERLRSTLGISIEDYKRSFEAIPDVRKQISGGRSGCMVLPTKDRRFIIKMIPRVERENLLGILDEYIDHLIDFPNSLLVKFTGLYDLRIKGSKNFQSLVIMQNVLHTDTEVQEIYDLKGSYVGRNAITMKHKGDVHNYSGVRKDMDLRRNLVVGGRAKMYIDFQLSQDTSFLNKFNLMDYSLLVGIHNCSPDGECCKERREHEISKERGKLTHEDISKWGVRGAGPNPDDPNSESVYFFGIIDVLQAWTTKKRAESFFKSNLAGRDKHGISAVDADEYAQRFCEFVLSHLKE